MAKTKRQFSPAQKRAQAQFAAMARNRARPRPQGGVSRSNRGTLAPLAEALVQVNKGPTILRGNRALHVVLTTATATAAALAGAAGAAVTGDSLVTRNYKNPRIAAMWGTQNTNKGFAQVAWPTGHDTTRGYRHGNVAGPTVNPNLLLAIGMQLPLTPQEVIAVTLGGNAVAGDVEQLSWLTAYDEDLGQRWRLWEEVRHELRELTTIDASLALANGPGYSGQELVNADSDLLLANRDYAWLGTTVKTGVHLTGLVGPDTGNDRLAVPGITRYEMSARWWPQVLGMVPIINSGNRASTNLFGHTDENAVAAEVTLHLALLSN